MHASTKAAHLASCKCSNPGRCFFRRLSQLYRVLPTRYQSFQVASFDASIIRCSAASVAGVMPTDSTGTMAGAQDAFNST